MRNAFCYVTALLYLSFFYVVCFTYIYTGGSIGSPPTLSLAAPLLHYPWRRTLPPLLPPLLDLSSSQPDPTSGNGLRVRLPGKDGSHAGDLRFSEGLVLNQRQRHSALCSILYSSGIGFRAPFVHQMTDDDVNDSWVRILSHSLFMCCV